MLPEPTKTMYYQMNGLRLPCESIDQARAEWVAFRDQGGVGASECCGVRVFDGDEMVARVSYNGRVWSPNGDEIL